MARGAMSTAARGKAYELACLRKLQDWMCMRLYRTGGSGDRGMDLCGWWTPSALVASKPSGTPSDTLSHAPDNASFRIVVQCKAERKAVGPAVVRELEGTLIRALWDKTQPMHVGVHDSPLATDLVAAPSDTPLVGILTSLSGFSKHALLSARSSRVPLLLAHLASSHERSVEMLHNDEPLTCRGFVWNDALSAPHGLLRGRFSIAWEAHSSRTPQVAILHDGIIVA